MVRICRGSVFAGLPHCPACPRRRCPAWCERVVAVNVQRIEVEPLRFEFRTFDDAVPDRDEGIGDVLTDGVDRVACPDRFPVVEHGDVHAFGGENALAFGLFEVGFARLEGLVHLTTGGPHRLAGGGLRTGGRAAISRLARASEERSPAWSMRACFNAARSAAAAMATRAASTASCRFAGSSAAGITGSKFLLGADTPGFCEEASSEF